MYSLLFTDPNSITITARLICFGILRSPFILHTLGGFNESSFLRCRRPVYRLPHPPQPFGSSEWFGGEDAPHFWDEMIKLHEESPRAAPEPDPVDDVEIGETENLTASLRMHQQEER